MASMATLVVSESCRMIFRSYGKVKWGNLAMNAHVPRCEGGSHAGGLELADCLGRGTPIG